MIKAWSDGSCNNATKNSGGYGILIRYPCGLEKKYSGGCYVSTSSARMEILGMLKTLEKIKEGEEVEVFIDNECVVNTLDKGWIFKWQVQGFKGKKNVDLWKKFLVQYKRLGGKVKLTWIKGHAGHLENEIVDHLAAIGSKKKTKIIDKK